MSGTCEVFHPLGVEGSCYLKTIFSAAVDRRDNW